MGTKDFAEGLSGDYDLPFIYYTPYQIFSGNIPIFDINFFSAENNTVQTIKNTTGQGNEEYEVVSESSAWILKPLVSGWYYAFRNVAIVALLSILVYVGIRMLLSSVASDKAKYKQMLIDWMVAICLVFAMHYIMVFIVETSENISGFFSSRCIENIVVDLPVDTKVGGKTLPVVEGNTNPQWICTFTGYTRLAAKGFLEKHTMKAVAYTILYLVMVIYTVIFTVVYLKRVLYMAFLTMIAPLIAITYPIDKLNDGQAQGFNKWLKEYIFNALLQPFHLLLYTVLIGSVLTLAEKYPIYAIVALGFMIPAEKMLRNMFGFEKASSPATMGAMGVAGASMLMSGMHKLIRNGGKKREEEDSDKKDNKIRIKPDRDNPLDTYANQVPNRIEDTQHQVNTEGIENNENEQIDENQEDTQRDNDNLQRRNQIQEETERIEDRENEDTRQEFDDEVINGNEMLRQSNNEEIQEESPNTNHDELQEEIDVRNEENRQEVNRQSGSQIPKTNIRKKIGNGVAAVGLRYYNKMAKSHPLRKIRRGVTYGIGAGALGMIGLAAGIASGDLGKTAQYTATAGHIGGSLGKNIGNKVASSGNKNIETFKQGYYGTEYEDKVREKQIKQLQNDPNNIQYLRARDENYKQILKEAYPEYARKGCYDIEDFWAAYQLEKEGMSRELAISTYQMAKRTGDITTSPDAQNKWKKTFNEEFKNNENISQVREAELKKIKEQYKRGEEEIQKEYDKQYQQIMRNSSRSEEYRKIQEQQSIEENQIQKEHEKEYNKMIKDIELKLAEQLKSLEEQHNLQLSNEANQQEKQKLIKEYKEKREKLIEEKNKNTKKKKQELDKEFVTRMEKMKDEYQKQYDNIPLNQEEKDKVKNLNEQKKEKRSQLQEKKKKQEEKIENISIRFSESALESIKQFYNNRE